MSEGQGKVSDWISDKYNRLAMGMDEEKGYW
jgi:archaellum biogenesis protein FlaJ (TadC family)